MAGRREGNDEHNAQEHAEPAGPWVEALLRHARVVMVRVQLTPERRILALSGALEELGQVEAAALRREPALLWQMVHPDDQTVFEAAAAGDAPTTVVVRWQRRDGPAVWTEHAIQPWSEADGASRGFAAMVRDVSERRQAFQELERVRRDSAYFHTLIHTVNDGILVNAVDGAIEFVNSQLAGLLHATPEEMVGRYIFDYMDDESAAAAKENLRRRREGAEDQFDFRWQRKDGSAFWSIVAAKPLYDAEGRHRGSLVAVTDISRRKQAEDELLRARDELEQRVTERTEALNTEVAERRRAEAEAQAASQTKSLFLANMSHELRTPLNAILGYSELVIEEAEPEATQLRTDVERIRGAAEHLLELINNILDLSKIEASKMELSVESFVLGELLDDLRSTILPLMIKNQNRMQVQCPARERTVATDRTKLKQVILNLLSNACKFTRRGWIDLRVTLAWEEGVEWLGVEVADTGIGIPEHKLPNLFHLFAQADGSVARMYGGTGLGLAISRELCRLLGGEIAVHSKVGEGTTFSLRIPVQAALPAGREEMPAAPVGPLDA
jgi:PAS domain S-box-containing protein